jgi:glycosyltransferase involved in cell wall biosynthesis
MSDVLWSIDYLVINTGAIFGFGWVFHKENEIESVYLKVESKDGKLNKTIPVDAGTLRKDVGKQYSGNISAKYSGFTILGGVDELPDIGKVYLECHLDNGVEIEVVVPQSNIHNTSKIEGVINYDFKYFFAYLKKGVNLLSSGEFAILFERIKNFLSMKSKAEIKRPIDVSLLFKKAEEKNVCLIIDHDLGGGANQYRNNFIEGIIKEGRSVLIVTFHLATLSYELKVKNNRINLRFSIPDLDFISQVCKFISVGDIIYNTSVSFVKPTEIPVFLRNLKKQTSGHLCILIHDFYMVCPSHFLLNNKTEFCNIPDISACAKCLPKNSNGFVSLLEDYNMHKWRDLWGLALACADEVVAFSNSSAQLLNKAYPHNHMKIIVRPHKVEYLTGKNPVIKETSTICIGVLGDIGIHKGAYYIQNIAKIIKERGLGLKIVIIGSINVSCDSSVVRQTGMYSHDKLPRIIEDSGVNIMLFPSFWPETFSYVVQELIDMDLPVACLNIGAPAERLSKYSKGLVLNSMKPENILDELILFHQKIYFNN